MSNHLKLLLLLALINVKVIYGQSQDTTINVPYAKITGYSPSQENCKFYKENDWLPDAFIHNATCACLKTPNTREANVIRYLLQEQLDSIPDSLKQIAKQKKEQYRLGKLSQWKYRLFIKKYLTKPIYKHHALAYTKAGCKGKTAGYQAWEMVTCYKIKNPNLVWFSIKCFGSCTDCVCKW